MILIFHSNQLGIAEGGGGGLEVYKMCGLSMSGKLGVFYEVNIKQIFRDFLNGIAENWGF